MSRVVAVLGTVLGNTSHRQTEPDRPARLPATGRSLPQVMALHRTEPWRTARLALESCCVTAELRILIFAR